jgi:hypothetical protein
MRGTAGHDRIVLAVAALFVCAHLAWLTGHLEDIDSINFALGLRHYDVAAHQPHPPGYPVFTLVARGLAWLVSPFAADDLTRRALGMAALASIAGGLALLALYQVLRWCVSSPSVDAATARSAHGPVPTRDVAAVPLVGTLLTATSPLFWLTAARPLSDMPGLAAALTCQALLLRASAPTAQLRAALVAAAACGVATGVRSQVTWLVVPLLAWLFVLVWRRRDVRAALAVAATALGGVLVWAVPMVALTGGVAAYRVALTAQAGEDFDGVPMLVMQPGVRRLLQALADTVVSPWGWWPLAVLVSVLAVAGVLALRGRTRLATWLGLGYLPYVVYHLLFQETETTRYALPLMPFVAALSAIALARWMPRLAPFGAAAIGVVALGVSLQAHRQYVDTGATIAEALARMEDAARDTGRRPLVLMHRRVWAETRRARTTITPSPGVDVEPSPRALEWQGGVPTWQAGGRPVWWMVDPRRGDRAAVDPRGLHLREQVAWPMPVAALLGGMRPHAFDWYDASSPQWVLLEGWGLSPELAGLTAAAGQGPLGSGATALVRAQPGAVTLVLGGRLVAPAGTTMPVRIDIDGRWQEQVPVASGAFVLVRTLPAGTLTGTGYVTLRVAATPAATGPAAEVFLEQFDLQPAGVPVVALERGWYEPERDTVSGREWRWVGDESALRIGGATGDVRLRVSGTYPRHYDRAPVLELFAGTRRIGSHTLTRPFTVEQTITAQQLDGDARLTWRVAPSFVAGERTGTADARRLALEIATLRVDAVR